MNLPLRPFLGFIARDALLAALTLAALGLDATARAGGRDDAWLGAAAGVLVALASFLLHEWGHWLGAVLAGARVHRPRTVFSPFLFWFDTGTSSRAQFLSMSIGGYLATGLAAGALLAWWTPGTTSGQVASVLAFAGIAVTLVAEVPVTVRVARGGPLPTGFAYVAAEGEKA